MSFRFILFILLFFITAYPTKVLSLTFNRPVPEYIVLDDITKIQDVSSLSVAIQIHDTLFKMDSTNTPRQNLVKHFFVSKDMLKYTFLLDEKFFHDNTKLNSEIVIQNIKHYLINKTENYEQLFSIAGAEEFANKKSSIIIGLVTDKNNPHIFSILLKHQDIRLLHKLSDEKLSILKTNRDPKIGLGEYKLEHIFPDKIVLSKFKKNQLNSNNSADSVIYFLNINKADALSGFIRGIYDDLFLYELTEEDIKKLKPYAQFKTLNSPRVYTLILNTHRIRSKKERILFLSKINWDKLREDCYQIKTRAYSLMPKGFLGYKKDISVQTKEFFEKIYNLENKSKYAMKQSFQKKYKILISHNSGDEFCVKENFESANQLHADSWKIKIVPHLQTLNSWKKNQIDAMYVWLEGSTHLNFWGFFNPKSDFYLGDSNNSNEFSTIYEKYSKAINNLDKEKYAREMDDYILNSATVFPIFYPKIILAYSKKYLPLNIGLHFEYSIPLSAFVKS